MSLDSDFKNLADKYLQDKGERHLDREERKVRWENAKGVLHSICDPIKIRAHEEYSGTFAVEFVCVNGQCILSMGPRGGRTKELTFSFDDNNRIIITDSMGSVEHRLDLPLDSGNISQIEARVATFMRAFFEKLALTEE